MLLNRALFDKIINDRNLLIKLINSINEKNARTTISRLYNINYFYSTGKQMLIFINMFEQIVKNNDNMNDYKLFVIAVAIDSLIQHSQYVLEILYRIKNIDSKFIDLLCAYHSHSITTINFIYGYDKIINLIKEKSSSMDFTKFMSRFISCQRCCNSFLNLDKMISLFLDEPMFNFEYAQNKHDIIFILITAMSDPSKFVSKYDISPIITQIFINNIINKKLELSEIYHMIWITRYTNNRNIIVVRNKVIDVFNEYLMDKSRLRKFFDLIYQKKIETDIIANIKNR